MKSMLNAIYTGQNTHQVLSEGYSRLQQSDTLYCFLYTIVVFVNISYK